MVGPLNLLLVWNSVDVMMCILADPGEYKPHLGLCLTTARNGYRITVTLTQPGILKRDLPNDYPTLNAHP